MFPLPDKIGLGFSVKTPSDNYKLYKYEDASREKVQFHNYFFTPTQWNWPEPFKATEEIKVVDGFSPNLNKSLHIGHLRNLANAVALSRMFPHWKFVAILGTSLGVLQDAQKDLFDLFKFVNYSPEVHYDCLQPWDIVQRQPGTGDNSGAQVWINKDGKELIVVRSDLFEHICNNEKCKESENKNTSFYLKHRNDAAKCPMCNSKVTIGKSVVYGRPNYIFHDLAFAQTVKPDYYITGNEQTEHFRDLGFAEKHLAMGLVCDKDNKKLKSRSGDAMTAKEALELIESRLNATPQPKQLAWNIMAWNFLHANRQQNVRFDPEAWTDPKSSPGLYITYTYARLFSALFEANRTLWGSGDKFVASLIQEESKDMTELDLKILAHCEYGHYYKSRAVSNLDPAVFANYIHDLCRVLNDAYNKERIVDGRKIFQYTIAYAIIQLKGYLQWLGMFCLTKV